MKGFAHVLVPLDFADKSSRILTTALRVLAPEGRLTMLHVVEWLPAVTEGTFGIYAHRKDIETYKRQALAKLRASERQHPDEQLVSMVQEGKPATTILEAIDELAPDLVVMGTHGRSRLDHLLIGSVAERVLRKAPCPILAVRF